VLLRLADSDGLSQLKVERAKGNGRSSSDDLDAGRIAELTKQLFTILPGRTEGAHVGHAKTRDYDGQYPCAALLKFAVHHCALRLVHRLRQRNFVVEIRGDSAGDGLLRDRHGVILCFLVALI
jgi:hypothetical protein